MLSTDEQFCTPLRTVSNYQRQRPPRSSPFAPLLGFNTSYICHFKNNYANVNVYWKYLFLQNVSRSTAFIADGTNSRSSKFHFFPLFRNHRLTHTDGLKVSIHLWLFHCTSIMYRVPFIQYRSNTVDYRRLRFISNTIVRVWNGQYSLNQLTVLLGRYISYIFQRYFITHRNL